MKRAQRGSQPAFPAGDGMPPVNALMHAAPLTVAIDATVREAEDLMIDSEVRHLPVLGEAGELVGIVSDRDVAFTSNSAEPGLSERLTVRDVCSLDFYGVAPDAPLDEVLATMAERRLGSALVVEAGKVVGIFTATDACREFAALLRDRFGGAGS